MKYTIAVLALIGAVDARHHHHQQYHPVIGNVLAQHKAGSRHHAKSHLRSRDSFNLDPETVSEYDALTGPDQVAAYETGRQVRREPGPEDDPDLAEDTPYWDRDPFWRRSQYTQHHARALEYDEQPQFYHRPIRAQVRTRDSFNGDEDTVDATDSLTGPDQTSKAHKSYGDPNEIDPDTVDDGVNLQRRTGHHKSNKARDTYDSDPNTVSPYDSMHGAEYHPRVFEGVQQKTRHHHKYIPRDFQNIAIWQDADLMGHHRNKTDAYDGDQNTVSPYDADKQYKYEKFVDKKADNKPTWSSPGAGSQYSAMQVNSTTNAKLVSNSTAF